MYASDGIAFLGLHNTIELSVLFIEASNKESKKPVRLQMRKGEEGVLEDGNPEAHENEGEGPNKHSDSGRVFAQPNRDVIGCRQ